MSGAAFPITTAGTFNVTEADAGELNSIVFNNPVASSTVAIWDGLNGAGTKLGTITIGATAPAPFFLRYNFSFSSGLSIVTTGTSDITVVHS